METVTHSRGGVRVLEERHAISVMLYLLENNGCRKSDLYRDVSRNPRMPEKLEMMESAGLLMLEPLDGGTHLRIVLTDVGREVAEALSRIDLRMSS